MGGIIWIWYFLLINFLELVNFLWYVGDFIVFMLIFLFFVKVKGGVEYFNVWLNSVLGCFRFCKSLFMIFIVVGVIFLVELSGINIDFMLMNFEFFWDMFVVVFFIFGVFNFEGVCICLVLDLFECDKFFFNGIKYFGFILRLEIMFEYFLVWFWIKFFDGFKKGCVGRYFLGYK